MKETNKTFCDHKIKLLMRKENDFTQHLFIRNYSISKSC